MARDPNYLDPNAAANLVAPISVLNVPRAPVLAAPAAPVSAAPVDPVVAASQFTYARNSKWVRPGEHSYNTPLAPAEELHFRKWLTDNDVPFNPDAKVTDYDMRGFWKALQSGDQRAASAVDTNDNRLHYPDYWKTPYHETFSGESQWANPEKAPHWNDKDQLVTPEGEVIFDDRAPKKGET